MTEHEKGFSQGYACAVSALVSMYGDSTEAFEVLRCNFSSIKEMRAAGVDSHDIEIRRPTIREIQRKAKL